MDNEIQFVETNNAEIAKHLFPDFKPTSLFLGLVKSEPEKYTEYGRFPIIRFQRYILHHFLAQALLFSHDGWLFLTMPAAEQLNLQLLIHWMAKSL